MRSASIGRILQLSFERTVLILFNPFSIKKWLFLLLIAFLAGSFGGGGGNLGSQNDKKDTLAASASQSQSVNADQESGLPQKGENDKRVDSPGQGAGVDREDGPVQKEGADRRAYALEEDTSIGNVMPWVLAFIVPAAIFLAGIAFVIFFMWLNARFKFIWFSAIVSNDASIAGPFRQYAKEGNSYLCFLLFLSFSAVLFFSLIFYSGYITVKSSGILSADIHWTMVFILKTFAPHIACLLIGLFIFCVVNVLTEDFILTIMALDKTNFLKAFGSFWMIIRVNQKDFWVYILAKIFLGFLTGFLVLAGFLTLLFVVLLTAAVLFGLPYVVFAVLMKVKMIFLLWTGMIGFPFLIISFLAFIAVVLPFAVFMKCFALYFLASLQTKYMPLPIV